MTKGKFTLASNKLTFDFGPAPNPDGIAEQKLIAHSVNVESLADGSGVRTRSGMKHYYNLKKYIDVEPVKTQILSGVKIPNVDYVSKRSNAMDIIYFMQADGKCIIKDIKPTQKIKEETLSLSFTHLKNDIDTTLRIATYMKSGYKYNIFLNYLSGSGDVKVTYTIGLPAYEDHIVETNNSLLSYDKHSVESYNNINGDSFIKGELRFVNTSGSGIEKNPVNTYSITGSVTIGPQKSGILIPIPLPILEKFDIVGSPEYDPFIMPIRLEFTQKDKYAIDTTNLVVFDGTRFFNSNHPSGQANTITYRSEIRI